MATNYSYGQLEGLWIAAGGPTSQASTAAAVAEAESGGNPDAAYPGLTIPPGTGTWNDATGLWQILGAPSGGNWTAADLTDPYSNAQMAVAKYEQAGNSFSPWQTYDQGNYTVANVPPVKWKGGATPKGGGSATPTDKNTNPPPPTNAQTTSFNPLNPASWVSPDMWQRIGLVVFGALLVLVGIFMLAGKTTIKVAGTAAKAAAI